MVVILHFGQARRCNTQIFLGPCRLLNLTTKGHSWFLTLLYFTMNLVPLWFLTQQYPRSRCDNRQLELHSLNIEPSYRADQGNMDWTVWNDMKMCLWWTCVPNYCVLKLLCYSFINPQLIDFVHIWAYVLLFQGVLMLLHDPKSTQDSVLQNIICNINLPHFVCGIFGNLHLEEYFWGNF